ncbi:MAG TPA: hypothetical protein DDY91_22835 [Planctomycetaceae bacterium]|jgi:hypothetical protein|nr:hypothetical protein [Planctomycetaceae bacterium]
MSSPDDFALKRQLVAVLAVGCFVAAGILWALGADPRGNPVLASLPRLGIVLGTLWYALPKTATNFVWSRVLTPVLIVVGLMALLRRAAWWILPAAIVVSVALVFIRPKPRTR